MYNFIKVYSSCWERFIDYIYLVENKKLSGKDFFILLIYLSLFSIPLLAFVFFLLHPLPDNSELSDINNPRVNLTLIQFRLMGGIEKHNAIYIKEHNKTIRTVVAIKCRLHPDARSRRFCFQYSDQTHTQRNTPVSGYTSRRLCNT